MHIQILLRNYLYYNQDNDKSLQQHILVPLVISIHKFSVTQSRSGGGRAQGGSPAAQRFLCTLRSPGSLFCNVIKGKQLQKSLNLSGRGGEGVAPTPWGQKL